MKKERTERPRRGNSEKKATGSVWRIGKDGAESPKFGGPRKARSDERKRDNSRFSDSEKPRTSGDSSVKRPLKRASSPTWKKYSDNEGENKKRYEKPDSRKPKKDFRERGARDTESDGRERRDTRFSKGGGAKPRTTERRQQGSEGDSRERKNVRFSKEGDRKPRAGAPERGKFGKPDKERGKTSRYSETDDRKPRFPKRDKFSKSDRPQKRKSDSDLVRLNKFIANSGVCSRREADEYIVAGLVTVNGVVVTELGTKVKPDDEVRFNNERLKGEKKVYLLLNKPKDYITTTDDPHAKHTVMELIEGACSERIYPVGRLDRNTRGLLLFTNDGELAKQLTHPSYNKLKVYQVGLDRDVTKRDMQALIDGVELEDGIALADAVDYVGDRKSEVGLEIHSGRNRVVRRMFEKLGYKVTKLDRSYFAGLTKKGLRRGEWRMLTHAEVEMLKMGSYT